jgi:hypothetical protein
MVRSRETLLGLLVLGLVIAGGYWSRSRTGSPGHGAARHEALAADHDATAAPAAQAHDQRAPGMNAGGHSGSVRAGADESLPDVTTADAAIDVDGVRVTLSLAPRPPVAFSKTHVRVRVEAKGVPLSLPGGEIRFEMAMPMGDHRYSLVAGADGWYDAEVVLPFCPSGNPRWYATVDGRADGRAFSARFRLDLTKP